MRSVAKFRQSVRLLPAWVALAAAAGLAASGAWAQVTVSDPWVRGTIAGQSSTGAYMRLSAAADAAVVAVSTPVAKVAELHEMKLDAGVMRMNAIPKLVLPAGKPVELKPGGYHVMLMQLTRPLKDGETVPLTITVQDAAGIKSTVEVKAIVRPLAARSPVPAHGH